MTDFTHLDALQARLFREQQRLAVAKSDNERGFRQREIASCEREIAAEYKFLGIAPVSLDEILMDDLITQLGDLG